MPIFLRKLVMHLEKYQSTVWYLLAKFFSVMHPAMICISCPASGHREFPGICHPKNSWWEFLGITKFSMKISGNFGNFQF